MWLFRLRCEFFVGAGANCSCPLFRRRFEGCFFPPPPPPPPPPLAACFSFTAGTSPNQKVFLKRGTTPREPLKRSFCGHRPFPPHPFATSVQPLSLVSSFPTFSLHCLCFFFFCLLGACHRRLQRWEGPLFPCSVFDFLPRRLWGEIPASPCRHPPQPFTPFSRFDSP